MDLDFILEWAVSILEWITSTRIGKLLLLIGGLGGGIVCVWALMYRGWEWLKQKRENAFRARVRRWVEMEKNVRKDIDREQGRKDEKEFYDDDIPF